MVVLFLLWNKNRISEKEFQNEKNIYLDKINNQKKKNEHISQELVTANSKISAYAHDVAELRKQIDEVKRELDFYKNIEEASGTLNVNDNNEEYQGLLEQATQQSLEARSQHPVSVMPHSDTAQDRRTLLDSEQAFTCKEMERSSDSFFITGKAGTGKSFLLDIYRRTTKKSHVVLAPTGIAALNVNGATLHSTFGYYNLVNLGVDAITDESIQLNSEKRLTLRNVSTIIIDEVSMVRADTFDKIDRILKAINHNNLPFGGKQILLFGDLFQLPPVAKAQEHAYLQDRYGGVYFFSSDAYKDGHFRFVELTINHRQEEDFEYFSLLNRIREGSTTTSDIEVLNSRVVQDESIYDRFTTLLPKKQEVEEVNRKHMDQLNSAGCKYEAQIILNNRANNNPNLESIFPIAETLYLKKGALVMMVSNDPEHRWVNGTLGIVNTLSNKGISVAIDKRTYDILPVDFTEQEVTYIDGKITYEDVLKVKQYPIVPAYAITIHKSQGQTYQNVVCDIDRCFTNGQAYVALSRCASLNGLHLKRRITGASIHVDNSVVEFYKHLKA